MPSSNTSGKFRTLSEICVSPRKITMLQSKHSVNGQLNAIQKANDSKQIFPQDTYEWMSVQ